MATAADGAAADAAVVAWSSAETSGLATVAVAVDGAAAVAAVPACSSAKTGGLSSVAVAADGAAAVAAVPACSCANTGGLAAVAAVAAPACSSANTGGLAAVCNPASGFPIPGGKASEGASAAKYVGSCTEGATLAGAAAAAAVVDAGAAWPGEVSVGCRGEACPVGTAEAAAAAATMPVLSTAVHFCELPDG